MLHVKLQEVSAYIKRNIITKSSLHFDPKTNLLKSSLTMQPVGSQHLRGFGNNLDQAFDTMLLCLVSFLSSSRISTQHLINESCKGLYSSDSPSLQKKENEGVGRRSLKSSHI